MKVYDCFSFYNEIELLEVRLHELHDVVDYFVLVESPTSHSGKSKPLYYYENKHLFRSFKDKIIHLIVNLPMTGEKIQEAITPQDRKWLDTGYQLGDNWVRERYQRNCMMRAIQDCDPDDIIIIEDADELIRSEVIAKLRKNMPEQFVGIVQSMNFYYINWRCTNMPWSGSKVAKAKYVTNPSEHRFHTTADTNIMDGGWHFAFLGGADAVKRKIENYAHQEFNNPACLDNIEDLLASRKDGLGRLYQYDLVPIDDSYPKYIRENLYKFDHWIYKGA